MASAAVASVTSSSTTTVTTATMSTRSTTENNDPTQLSTHQGTSSDATQPQTQPQHHLADPDALALPAMDTTDEAASKGQSETPLPPELGRVLLEVANTGSCSWLAWDTESREHVPQRKASPFSTTQGPPRKKLRNGRLKPTSRKRSFILLRPNNTANTSGTPASVGSGKTSGSEPDDSTQYECDSEGTSATSNSEVSSERLRLSQQRALPPTAHGHTMGSKPSVADGSPPVPLYRTLQEACRIALGMVLDHFYHNFGGYKLSPSEKRKIESTTTANSEGSSSEERTPLTSRHVFQQRRQNLMNMVKEAGGGENSKVQPKRSYGQSGPPFTIQRIAEILVSPERSYKQTHKLCNGLEKLLLVTSSSHAFGGGRGGDTEQSRDEEVELAALAAEKERQELELRRLRLRQRAASFSDDAGSTASSPGDGVTTGGRTHAGAVEDMPGQGEVNTSASVASGAGAPGLEIPSSEEMEAARASLRTKFDHVGMDPHSPDRDVRAIVESRTMTNSPPPPDLSHSAAAANLGLQGHAGFVRHHASEQGSPRGSPVLFPHGGDGSTHSGSPVHATHALRLHEAAMASVTASRNLHSHLDPKPADPGSSPGNQTEAARKPEGTDGEVDLGRSPASNSDVDSEFDDVLLDDSASDRSDGSDSGAAAHLEPFTVARVMALNRMQQQQRLQHRMLMSFKNLNPSEPTRPPPDSEYQSGDSIDSMKAEDSAGSESSSQSSDIAEQENAG